MSAIVGIYQTNEEPINPDHSKGLMQSLQQFPADDIQVWQKENIFLGCHAQWITPESIGEKVPYYDYDRRLAITVDAIIDNRDELFEKLQVKKEYRKTMPDSQLILLAYEKWEEDTPKYLLGDFAFMIWDARKRKLFGARDFSGARTLYYFYDQRRFAFSTTIEPLFTLPYVEKKLNEEWLAEFLAIPSMVEAVDMTSTVYKGIFQVPPSHSISVVDGRVTVSRYYRLVVKQELKLKSNEDYEEAFRDVFDTAVKARLRTPGKVGSHLSGGLDSGTVVSFAAKALKKENKQLHTYSFYPEEDFVDWTSKHYIPDERPFIKETVKHVGNIHDQYFNFEGMSPLSEVDHFLEIMEMPYKFFENSFWLKGINEKAQHDGVKVLLNGARGNHSISWGSLSLTYDYYATLLKKLRWIRLYHELDLYCKNFQTGKSVMVPFVTKKAFPVITRILNREKQSAYRFPQFINPNLADRTNIYEKLQDYGVDVTGNGVVDNLNEYRKNYYQQLYPWNKSGVANTKLSLRYSLWDRDPTNDLRVIQFCLALPKEQFVQDGIERSFLRRATKNFLPDNVRLNQKSRGVQGADVIHRMAPNWNEFMNELQSLCEDPSVGDLLHIERVKNAITNIGIEPQANVVFEDDFKIATRSLIVYRFIKNIERR